MPTPDDAPISATEAKALFCGLEDLPAMVLAVSGGPDSTALMWLAAPNSIPRIEPTTPGTSFPIATPSTMQAATHRLR